jgi:class 3 adenylate cyclase
VRENVRWEKTFGTQAFEQDMFSHLAPSYLGDRDLYAFFSRLQRHAASPSSFAGFIDLLYRTDIGGILGSISVPTQVLHRVGDIPNPISWSRRLAALIPDATLVELDGSDWWPFLGDADALLDAVEAFVLGRPVGRLPSRSLRTVLFTDIVGSTERLAALGDVGWKDLIAEHDRRAKETIVGFGGRYVESTGDGFLATFDGPARATHCAMTLVAAVRDLGLELRAGVHTGEVEHEGDALRGITVHIGARVAGVAGPSEVLVSRTVRDLTAGSGIAFEDAGEHDLKGVPDRWHLYRAVG